MTSELGFQSQWILTNRNEESRSGSWKSRQIVAERRKGFWGRGVQAHRQGLQISLSSGSRLEDDWMKMALPVKPAQEYKPHLKGSKFEIPAVCHFKRPVQFNKRSVKFLGDIYCLCCVFCFIGLLSTAVQHTPPWCPRPAWCHLYKVWLYCTHCTSAPHSPTPVPALSAEDTLLPPPRICPLTISSCLPQCGAPVWENVDII